ncbi:hypothetical protein Bhyg_03622, partial [Pseudolycoriella hygida]
HECLHCHPIASATTCNRSLSKFSFLGKRWPNLCSMPQSYFWIYV